MPQRRKDPLVIKLGRKYPDGVPLADFLNLVGGPGPKAADYIARQIADEALAIEEKERGKPRIRAVE